MRCPSPLCSLRPPDRIGGAGDDSALDRASGVERRLERLGLDGGDAVERRLKWPIDRGDDARESPDGPMVRSPESSVDVRCDMCPRWSAKSLWETLRSATTNTQSWQGSWRVLVLRLSERMPSSRRPSSQPSPAARWATHDTWRSLECARLDSPALSPTCNSSGDAQRGRIEQGLLQHHHATE